jgi:hypothetical protein
MNIEETLAEIKDSIAKAAVTNATYTQSPATRSIFAPENLDPVIKLIVPTATPIRSMMPRSKGFGQAAAWKKLTSQLAPGNLGTGTITGANAGSMNRLYACERPVKMFPKTKKGSCATSNIRDKRVTSSSSVSLNPMTVSLTTCGIVI